MDSSADNWLGPKLEQELNNVIEWKKRDNDPAPAPFTLATDEQSPYSYDGSNLWIIVVYAIEEPVLVQVQQVSRSALKSVQHFQLESEGDNLRANFGKHIARNLWPSISSRGISNPTEWSNL